MKTVKEYISEAIVKGKLTQYNNGDIDYVDLDLPSGLKWATCNIGADKPEDPGLLFQWGRTDGYKYNDNKHKFLSSKDYVTTSGKEYKEGDVLDKEDDAAYVNTNGKFRTPTKEEIKELLQYTDNEWAELNGVKGYKFTSKKDESKYIFIPAAGFLNGNDGSFNHGGSDGLIWSSSVYLGNSNFACLLYSNSSICNLSYNNRYSSLSVRGVKE